MHARHFGGSGIARRHSLAEDAAVCVHVSVRGTVLCTRGGGAPWHCGMPVGTAVTDITTTVPPTPRRRMPVRSEGTLPAYEPRPARESQSPVPNSFTAASDRSQPPPPLPPPLPILTPCHAPSVASHSTIARCRLGANPAGK